MTKLPLHKDRKTRTRSLNTVHYYQRGG